ncbi:MAG: extracellular solute-binding protein [Candidatus Wenzhouxiangella sp. M2_3B_020]
MRRRALLRSLALAGLLPSLPAFAAMRADGSSAGPAPVSVDDLPKLSGELTLYLGRGEGGLYEDILDAIRGRNPELELSVRRGPATALANTLAAEAQVGRIRADVFWSIDAASLGVVADRAAVAQVPDDLKQQLQPAFRYAGWVPISGRVRTIAYNTDALSPSDVPDSVMALPETDLKFGWAPAYGSFQSFVTAMRLLEGESATREWLLAMRDKATRYAGEFGVVMAVSRGEVDLGFANHYYALRMKQGKPDAPVALTFTPNDAGSLLNASGAAMFNDSELTIGFVRHLLTEEVQSYLAREAYEIPLVAGISSPEGLPPIAEIDPPEVDLERLADLQPTLALLRETGVL